MKWLGKINEIRKVDGVFDDFLYFLKIKKKLSHSPKLSCHFSWIFSYPVYHMAAVYRLLPGLRLHVLQDLDDALPGHPGEDGEWRRQEEEEESHSAGWSIVGGIVILLCHKILKESY